MPLFKLRQLQEESDSWKRYLAFITEENICLKNRLSLAVKSSRGEATLNEMENFFNRSIQQDDFLALLRKDVSEFDKLLIREQYEDGLVAKKMDNQLNKNRINMRKFYLEFENLKSDFNDYLLEHIE